MSMTAEPFLGDFRHTGALLESSRGPSRGEKGVLCVPSPRGQAGGRGWGIGAAIASRSFERDAQGF